LTPRRRACLPRPRSPRKQKRHSPSAQKSREGGVSPLAVAGSLLQIWRAGGSERWIKTPLLRRFYFVTPPPSLAPTREFKHLGQGDGWLAGVSCGRNIPLSPKSETNGGRPNRDLNSESLSPTNRKINARQATTIIAMPKRKRNESISRSKDAPPATRAERLLEDGQRNVAGALKVCQRFERQKLGRRVKDATAAADSDSAKTLDRLNREIQALKVRRKS
jgi:hypothetical protein